MAAGPDYLVWCGRVAAGGCVLCRVPAPGHGRRRGEVPGVTHCPVPPARGPPPAARATCPRTPRRSSAGCCCAGTSSSMRRPRGSSPPLSRPCSRPVRGPGRRAGIRVFPRPAARRCSDPAPAAGLVPGLVACSSPARRQPAAGQLCPGAAAGCRQAEPRLMPGALRGTRQEGLHPGGARCPRRVRERPACRPGRAHSPG